MLKSTYLKRYCYIIVSGDAMGTQAGVDLSRYQRAPNGLLYVLTPEAANERLARRREELARRVKAEGLVYVPKDNELGQIMAAIRAGLPVALIGGAGIGKTTLVSYVAHNESLPLTTDVGDKAKLWELVGYIQEIGEIPVYVDGPVSLVARATNRSILYLDEAIGHHAAVFTALSSLFDNRRRLILRETGEELNAHQTAIVLSFNPPTIDRLDELPREAAIDRLVMIRFDMQDGAAALTMLKAKYGLQPQASRPATLRETTLVKAIQKYGAALERIYTELNSTTAAAHSSVVVKRVTPRSLENALRLVAQGLTPHEAATMAMVNPMVPVEDRLVTTFLTAAAQVIQSHLGTS